MRPSPISATRHRRTDACALKMENCRLVLANNKWHLPRLVGRELTGNKAAPTLPKERTEQYRIVVLTRTGPEKYGYRATKANTTLCATKAARSCRIARISRGPGRTWPVRPSAHELDPTHD
jgi:hypothetical protein